MNPNEEMKALSIQQPWLYCIERLSKPVENRNWRPPKNLIGKRIALHASTGYSRRAYSAASKLAEIDFNKMARNGEIVRGCITSTAVLSGYVRIDEYGDLIEEVGENPWLLDEYEVPEDNQWFFGSVGWSLVDVVLLPKPIEHKGRLGLWTVSPAATEAILKQIRAIRHIGLKSSHKEKQL